MKFYRQVTVATYRKKVGYQAGLLAGTCTLVAALILIGNTVTHERIDNMKKADQQKMLEQVIPAELHNNDLLADQFRIPVIATPALKPTEASSEVSSDNTGLSQLLTVYVARSDKEVSALAFPVTANGYGGDIDMIIGVDVNGNILGVRVISHQETPGLGDKIEISKDNWISRFNGLSLSNTNKEAWAVKKDGGKFDQFTGATITPRAVVRAIYQGLLLIKNHQQAISKAIKQLPQLANSVALADPAVVDQMNLQTPPHRATENNPQEVIANDE